MSFFITILSFLLSLFINISLSYANSTNFFTPDWWKTATLEDVAKELANGTSVKERDEIGRTPLMYASWYNKNPEIITTLLKHGASVNERDEDGWTPLMYASALNQNPEIITTLLKHGADAKAKSSEGKTALDYAKDNPKIYQTEAYWELNQVMYE